MPDLLLFAALREGTPDYLAGRVTGATPSPEREAFARPQERALWAHFQRDRQTLLARSSDELSRESAAGQAFYRWFAHYVERAEDKAQAIRELLGLKDPQAVLTASGYQERMKED